MEEDAELSGYGDENQTTSSQATISRTTRSASKPLSAKTLPVPPPSSSSSPLVPHGSLFAHLSNLFPGRSAEIRTLLGLLGHPSDPLPPLFVYGSASTGKTSILLEIFRHLHRPFAYTSFRSSHNPRILFESLLNQLLGHSRIAAHSFSSARKCEKLGDFVEFLADACFPKDGSSPIPFKSSKQHSQHANCKSSDHSEVVYLLFDNVELLLDWSGGFRLMSALLKLSEFTRLPNLALIFVSSLGPDAFLSGTGILQPILVYMRDYTDEELHQILLKSKPHVELYSSFLSAVLKPFSRVTRRVTELAETLEPLFQKYLDPIRRGVVKPDEQGKRKLFSLLQPHLNLALNQTFNSSNFPVPRSVELFSDEGLRDLTKKPGVDNQELPFQLSLCSKYLLVSAFICSRNPATLDATLFDTTSVTRNKRRRRSSQTSLEKKEVDRQEKLLKGPGTFSLERLLAIFGCISAEMTDNIDEEMEMSTLSVPEEKHGIELSSDVLMQVSTLLNANLLYKGSSDPLEGAPRYRCNADEELVQLVARSINFPLSRYLYRL